MKEIKTKENGLDMPTQKIAKIGGSLYNSIRDSEIKVYWGKTNGKIGLQDKKHLSMYSSIVKTDNFFSKILTDLGYNYFPDLSIKYNTNKHNENYEEEFNNFVNCFKGNNLEVIVLCLLDYPLITQFCLENGYSLWKIKIAVYDYLCAKEKECINQQNKQKVLTK